MTVFLVILSSLFLLGALLLLLPLSYSFRFSLGKHIAYRALGGSALLALLAERRDGITTFRWRLLGIPIQMRPGQKERRASSGSERIRKPKKSGFSWSLLNGETVKHFAGLLMDLLALIKPRVFRISARVGFAEPDLNGSALAAFYSLKSAFPGIGLHWQTEWGEETAEAEGEIAGQVIPGAVLWRLLVFILSRPTLRVFRELRRQKKRAAAAT